MGARTEDEVLDRIKFIYYKLAATTATGGLEIFQEAFRWKFRMPGVFTRLDNGNINAELQACVNSINTEPGQSDEEFICSAFVAIQSPNIRGLQPQGQGLLSLR